ncbi:TIGR02757 family protein [Arachidicoccus rhizosphaerae]|uniref:TIGR02757 family protein n=1 Tax=Arachidicoccus rhizosphaerae TaxID=551991 RepID=A0A1H3WJF3_9BACT|nr:TIGR02757 family protein [Arachidicoccus rhizosphaerae]SDZ87286.1 TIGR02757 family protein [Arachidicoccus rhizosphaerae]
MDLKKFLDSKVAEFNQPSFIKEDPVCVPHRFSTLQDQEIAGFFAAIFAWGNRKIIINKATELLERMDNAPYQFCLQHEDQDLKRLLGFKHRTFNDTDLLYFVEFFRHHYTLYESLEDAFLMELPDNESFSMEVSLIHFYHYFFSLPDLPYRTRKHIATPEKKATCKRLNMFLRWMVRKDNKGVDLGLWSRIPMSGLICPVDLHVAKVARKLGLLDRKQTDWRSAVELTGHLKKLDAKDPSKYDFALFGLGVVEKYY